MEKTPLNLDFYFNAVRWFFLLKTQQTKHQKKNLNKNQNKINPPKIIYLGNIQSTLNT